MTKPTTAPTAPTWEQATWEDRSRRCVFWLFVHDLITDGEHDRIKRRIDKAKAEGKL